MVFRFYGGGGEDSSREIAHAGQGGARLLRKPDFAKIRDAYLTRITRLFELTGTSADAAQAQARSVRIFETRSPLPRWCPPR